MSDHNLFDVIELIYEYQLLCSKRDVLGLDLSDEERGRVMGLGRLLEDRVLSGPARRSWARVQLRGPVQFTTPTGFGIADLHDIGGGGVALATRKPLTFGTRTVVRFVDYAGGRELIFPCHVVWSQEKAPAQMGLAFDGIPLRTQFRAPPAGEWRRGLLLAEGDAEELPVSA
jgi:PilZ domain-containing protein